MTSPLNKTAYILMLLAALLLQGCFTGVESTPKITYKEVQRRNAGGSSPEETLAAEFRQRPFRSWENGEMFMITSERISLTLIDESRSGLYPQKGDTIVYTGSEETTDITGKPEAVLWFTDLNGTRRYSYRTGMNLVELSQRETLELPFTIPLEMVGRVRKALKGERFYIKTPMWLNADNQSVRGQKFVQVTVTDVVAANDLYPFKVLFADPHGRVYGVYMSASTGSRWSPREFPQIFERENPRRNYPQIADDNWKRIINSQVAQGMTKTEVTLSLGTPSSIDRGHTHSSAYERWVYPEGRYVMFEDGLVVRYR